VDKAIAIDPLNVGILMNAGDILILQRRYGEAIRSLSQALELEPRFRPAMLRLSLACALIGQHPEASEALQQALSLGEADAAYHEFRALIMGQAENLEQARESAGALQEMAGKDSSVLPWSLARAWVSAGNQEKAIAFLNRAFDTHSSSMPFLGVTPVFDGIRQSSEFQALQKKAGLSD